LTGLVDKVTGVEIVCFDFTETFDLVPHDILIKVLAFYGINRANITWINSWLKD